MRPLSDDVSDPPENPSKPIRYDSLSTLTLERLRGAQEADADGNQREEDTDDRERGEELKPPAGGKGDGRGVDDEDGDEGYHTPASPSRAIPRELPCPPAPRKPPPFRRPGASKVRYRESYRRLNRRRRVPEEVILVICSAVDLDRVFQPIKKRWVFIDP